MKKAVIFDLDGVIIDSEKANIQLFIQFAKEVMDTDVLFDDAAELVGTSSEGYINMFHRYFGEKLDDILPQFEAYWAEHPLNYPKIVNKDAIALASWLKQNQIKTAIATMTPKQMLTDKLQAFDNSLFDLIISRDYITNIKPSPEIYLYAMEKLDVTPEETLVIEDSLVGIEAGKNAGCPVIARHDPELNIDQHEADLILEDLRDLIRSQWFC